MEFVDQHVEAQEKTLKVTSVVSVTLFNDKVKEMGCLVVENGVVTISLDHIPHMISEEATAEFLAQEIKLAIKACYLKHPDAFNNYLIIIE